LKYLSLLLKIIIISLMVFSINVSCAKAEVYDDYETYNLYAEVIKASDETTLNDGYATYKVQNLKVKILDEKFKNQEYDIVYYLEDGINSRLPIYDKFKVGDKLYVYGIYENNELSVQAASYYDKTPWVIGILVIYAALILVIGGKNGLKAILSLAVTVFIIFAFLIPAILDGKSPILFTILLSSIIIIISFVIVAGFKKKTIVAIIGTVAGVVAAGIIGAVFSNAMRLTGINEHARMISTIIDESKEMISFKDIMLSAIMISALGACMDVGMSISSALSELKERKPELTSKELIKSGMNIGKDVMGTMTNTLILAYVGSAMLCILLYNANSFDLSFILNSEDITDEVLKSLAGSIGLVCTIPFTAILGGIIIGNDSKKSLNKGKKETKSDVQNSKKEYNKADTEEVPVNYFKG